MRIALYNPATMAFDVATPEDQPLGGMASCICHLARALAARGVTPSYAVTSGNEFGLTIADYIRFAAAGAKFTTAFSRRGLIAEYGMSWILPRLVGNARALDLLFSGRVVLAEEAATMGLVNEVVAPEHLLDRALEYAAELATKASPTSMAVMKRQVYGDWGRGLVESTDRAVDFMVASLTRADFKEGVASFLQKRDPAFQPVQHVYPSD